MTVGDNIKRFRLEKGMTQKAMADILGIHVNTYMKWEENPKRIPISKAYKIAVTLGVSMDQILFDRNSTKCSVSGASVG